MTYEEIQIIAAASPAAAVFALFLFCKGKFDLIEYRIKQLEEKRFKHD